jgi:copper resistance protein C
VARARDVKYLKGGALGGALLLLLTITLLVVPAAVALAHAERIASEPKEGVRLGEAPFDLRVDFTEPPIANPQWEVFDGCGDDVTQSVKVEGTTVRATLAPGRPGRWEVRFQVVSGIDGHATRDRFRFVVAGQEDCAAAPQSTTRAALEDRDGDSSLGFFLILGALSVVIVVGAFVMRSRI